MSKYKDEYDKLKGVYLTNKQIALSYIYAFIISFIILSPLILAIFNLLFLTYKLVYIITFAYVVTLLFIYLILLFKDIFFVQYNKEAKEVNLRFIRIRDFISVAIIFTIIYIVYYFFI